MDINELIKEAQLAQTAKNFVLAEQCYSKACQLVPGNAEIEHLMAIMYYQAGAFDKAANMITSCLKINDKEARFHNTFGMIYRRLDKLPEAQMSFKAAIRLDQNYYDPIANLGNLLVQLSPGEEAVALLRKAVGMMPKLAGAHLNLGNGLKAVRQYTEALTSYNQALSINPQYTQAWYNKALVLNALGENQEAVQSCQKALALFPSYLSCFLLLGELQQQQGLIKEAQATFLHCLQLSPECGEAFWALANTNFHFNEVQKNAIKENLTRSVRDEQRIYYHFTLAKILEGQASYKEAFEHLEKGNSLKRKTLEYDKEFNRQYISTITNIYREIIKDRLEVPDNEVSSNISPIFVVGMPRSGTSLLERIIGSSDKVSIGGELNTTMELFFSKIPEWTGDNSLKSLGKLTGEIIARAKEFYLMENEALVSSNDNFTDKLPFNFAHIGVLSQMFPRARFVHVFKNPIDSCLGCYKQLFTEAQEFSYTIDELTDFYSEYRKCMSVWQRHLSSKIVDMPYEALVHNPVEETQRLFEFLNLDWHEDVLAFQSLKSISKTASSAQVREGINDKALFRWKRYGDALHPLVTKLQNLGIEVDSIHDY